MTASDLIRKALEQRGYKNMRAAGKALGVSSELLRAIVKKNHVPKDNTLAILAEKLGLDKTMLILAAHQAKVPAEVKGFFLLPASAERSYGKRIHPLSTEQCDYLEKMMSSVEIEFIRKYRLMTEESKKHIVNYIDYLYASGA